MSSLIIPNIKLVIEMIEKNIFRPLPVLKKAAPPAEIGMEEIEVLVDPSWPHL
jgi:serine/threonine-protein phosphatase 2A regulatory subunit B'